jgi:hypothetical protein
MVVIDSAAPLQRDGQHKEQAQDGGVCLPFDAGCMTTS